MIHRLVPSSFSEHSRGQLPSLELSPCAVRTFFLRHEDPNDVGRLMPLPGWSAPF
jgi:hypothetical protein